MTLSVDQCKDMIAESVAERAWFLTARALRFKAQREVGGRPLRAALRRCSGCRVSAPRGYLQHGYCFRCVALCLLAQGDAP